MWKPLGEVCFVKVDEIKISPLALERFAESLVELRTGVVAAVGTGTLLDDGSRAPLQVKVGDRITFGTKVGKEVTMGEDVFLMIAEPNILAVEVTNE